MKEIKLLGVKLCNTCNLNCEMCAQRKQSTIQYEIDPQNLSDAVDQLLQWKNRFEVYLWGGEPFLHPQFFQIVEAMVQRHLPVTVNTNGTRLYRYAEEICRSRIKRIIVSIDGTREIHNKIRGAEVYDSIVAGMRKVKLLRRFLPFITANIVVTQKNHAILPQIVGSLFSIGAEFIEIQLPFFYTPAEGLDYEEWYSSQLEGRALSWMGFCADYTGIDTDKLSADIQRLEHIYGEKVHFVPNIAHQDIPAYFTSELRAGAQDICSACTSQVRIEADGSVVLCPDYPDIVLGNIKDESILDILQKEPYRSIREKLAASPQHSLCHKCLFRFEQKTRH